MITLAKRERYFVAIAACGIGIFLLFQLLIAPFFESRARMQRGIKEREVALKDVIRLSAEYEAYKADSQGIEQLLAKRKKRKRGFTLFKFLDEKAGEAGLKKKKKIESMKPSQPKDTGPFKEIMVEVKLEAVTLIQLRGYLYRIESPEDLVSIKQISIKQTQKEDGYLDATLQAVTFE